LATSKGCLCERYGRTRRTTRRRDHLQGARRPGDASRPTRARSGTVELLATPPVALVVVVRRPVRPRRLPKNASNTGRNSVKTPMAELSSSTSGSGTRSRSNEGPPNCRGSMGCAGLPNARARRRVSPRRPRVDLSRRPPAARDPLPRSRPLFPRTDRQVCRPELPATSASTTARGSRSPRSGRPRGRRDPPATTPARAAWASPEGG
jgi:hypothetical protein